MQRESLEQFIRANRDAFDQATPSLKAWAEIDKQMSGRATRKITLWRSLRIAASVLVLLFAGAVAGNYLSNANQADGTVALEEIAPEYAEMAQYFEAQVNQRVQQLASYQQGEVVLEDIEQLDNYMEELKRDLARAPQGKEEEIIENLIRSYQSKIQILERVLERIHTTEKETLNTTDNEISI